MEELETRERDVMAKESELVKKMENLEAKELEIKVKSFIFSSEVDNTLQEVQREKERLHSTAVEALDKASAREVELNLKENKLENTQSQLDLERADIKKEKEEIEAMKVPRTLHTLVIPTSML